MDSRTPPHPTRHSSFLADSNTPTWSESSAPSTPLSSGRHRGPHRDGFSVKKCKDVLVRQCSWIPRNYNFKDGVNQVYEVLREYLGDENLDLAIAQLNELIEVPSQWPHDEGAYFQAWKHDYMLRHKDFENSHVPRLRNIIVAPINPTERLKKWREEQPERATLLSSRLSETPSYRSETQSKSPDYGIGARARGGDWRLENALFVSSKAQGTRVLQCPSAEELHSKTWNEEFGRGGKLVHERTIIPDQTVDEIVHLPSSIVTLERKKSFADLRSMRLFADIPVIRRWQSITTVPEVVNNSLHRTLSPISRSWRSKGNSMKKTTSPRTRRKYLDPLHERFAGEVMVYEGNPAVRDLPDPGSETGKSYYSNIPTWPLPVGTCVPSPRFARKHCLVPAEVSLPGFVAIKLVPTADEMVIGKSLRDEAGLRGTRNGNGLIGPFTPELFKDSGIDFPRRWGDSTLESVHGDCDLGDCSDIGALGDATQSPSKLPQAISVSSQKLSWVSAIPSSKQQRLDISPNGLSCHLRYDLMPQSANAAPKSKELDKKRCGFSRLKYHDRPTPNMAQESILLHQAGLILKPPRTDLAKAIRQLISASLCREYTLSLVASFFQKFKPPRNILKSTPRYHRRSTLVTQTKSCDVTKPVNLHQPSRKPSSANHISEGSRIEINKQIGSFPEMGIPRLIIEPPSEGSEDHPMQDNRPEKRPLRNNDQRRKGELQVEGHHLVEKAFANAQDTTLIGDYTDLKTTVELVNEFLREARYICSETKLNWGSFRMKTLPRVAVNNTDDGEALRTCYCNNIKAFITNSLSTSLDTLPIIVHKRGLFAKKMLDLQNSCEVDLNRDLPPLPIPTNLQALQIDDQFSRRNLEAPSDDSLEFLQPSYYDPVRDSLKYGGIHYHPDGIQYSPEVLQHPPRTSSMLPPSASSDAIAVRIKPLQVKPTGPVKPSIGVPTPTAHRRDPFSEPHTSYTSKSSSGIMGNFIPVKTTAPPSTISNVALNIPSIVENGDMSGVNQNSKSNDPYAMAPSHIFENSRCSSEKTDGPMADNSRRVKISQGLGGTVNADSDHHSVNLNDPEALAKYIRHLKEIKKRAEIKKQSSGLKSSLLRKEDGEANKFVDNHNEDEYHIFLESGRGANIMPQDYSEIQAGNPFEFEPDGAESDPNRLTTFTDFMGEASQVYQAPGAQNTRKRGHLKNSYSESNAWYVERRPEPIQLGANVKPPLVLYRSDSSPGISPARITTSRDAAQVSLPKYYDEECHPDSRSSSHSHYFDDPQKSPTRAPRHPKSQSKQVNDLPGSQEILADTHSSNTKRPWSPVKKIFGEGGWLINTTSSKEEASTPKRPGLVEKIKLKIEEIGLKADLSPMKYSFRGDQEKSWENSTFPISLNPAQQAELYLDIELLICDSANTFLMHEYQNGRMSVDSLKRVTDFWKSKGRPQVVEFHYDQSTQRDLIVANQKTFRFYGPNANNPLQVHAMLYAWKTNAREMAVRTFCYPDSMIRKHIQDTFVMLDFLGGHPFQYIAAHEVQGKLVRWVQKAQVHISARSSRTPSVKKVGHRSNESLTELVADNPWHNSGRPVQSPSKQKT